jgi:hypothetical protein
MIPNRITPEFDDIIPGRATVTFISYIGIKSIVWILQFKPITIASFSSNTKLVSPFQHWLYMN